jgi:DHA1 family bicyclomycin/chloramphenicol resistance-like MFS transporter
MPSSIVKSLVLITVIFMDLLTGMEFDLFVPSFPQLQSDFSLTPFWVEALLSVNFIGYCLSLFFVGKLADRFGRKPIILSGLVVFTVGSIFCLYSHSYQLLILGRFLQGVGVAAPAVLSFLIIADSYPLKDQQFLIAMLNGVMNLAVAFSPVIGSYLTLYFHWQGNFIALLLMGLITLFMTLWFIPLHKTSLNNLEPTSAGYGVVIRSKPLMLLIISMLFMFSPYWIFVGMSPLLYMQELNVSLTHFGYYQGVLALVFAVGCVLFGLKIRQRNYNVRKMQKISLQILIVSFIIFVTMTIMDSKSALFITLAFIPFIIAQIIPSVILYPLSLNFMPDAKARTSSLIQGSRLILTSIGVQITGYFYQHSFFIIGLVMSFYILVAIVTMYRVLCNEELMGK